MPNHRAGANTAVVETQGARRHPWRCVRSRALMTSSSRRRLVVLLAVALVSNTVFAPVGMAHVWLEGHSGRQLTSDQASLPQEETAPPCHGHDRQTENRNDHRTGSLPCCAGSTCSCVSLSLGLPPAGATPQALCIHDHLMRDIWDSFPQAPPESFLRPPIS